MKRSGVKIAWIAAAALVVAGCKEQKGAEAPEGSKTEESSGAPEGSEDEAKLEGPVEVGFGDCAGPSARFESGPRPRPFDLERVEADMKRRRARQAEDGEEDEEEEESGGTGTAMALSKGKMGKKVPIDAPERVGRRAEEKRGVAGRLEARGSRRGGAFAPMRGTSGEPIDDSEASGGRLGDKEPPDSPERSDDAYAPGEKNPLRDRDGALEDCFGQQTARRYAAMVVEMRVGDDGAVGEAQIHGATDEDMASCISGVAEEITWKTDARTYRCPITFGPMPVAEAPGVEITEDEIALAGEERQVVARTEQVAAGAPFDMRIPKLYEPLIALSGARERGLPEDIVSITGPRVLRPASETPMKVVTRVVHTAAAAGMSHVLAVERDGGWELLPRRGSPETLPAPPVPYGTGGRWYESGHHRGGFASGGKAPLVRGSVLIAPDALWVGLTTGDRRKIETEGGAYDWDTFDEILAEFRKGPLGGSHQIEIAARDEVPYGAFVKAVDHLAAADFDAWNLADPRTLSVRFME